MNERDRVALREWREQQEEQERREREAAERPIREAEAALNTTVRQLHQTIRERVANGRDDEFTASDPTATMPIAEAQNFNAENAAKFAASTPGWFPSAANKRALLGYLQRNGVQIATVADYQRAFRRLSEFGLLEMRPEPEPEVEPQSEPGRVPEVESAPAGEMGWDPFSGEPRFYTNKEIAAMSGDEYRRRFRIYRNHLELPSRNW